MKLSKAVGIDHIKQDKNFLPALDIAYMYLLSLLALCNINASKIYRQ